MTSRRAKLQEDTNFRLMPCKSFGIAVAILYLFQLNSKQYYF